MMRNRGARVLVGVDRRAAWVLVHGEQHGGDAGMRHELLEVARLDAHADDEGVDGQRDHPPGRLGERERNPVVHLERGDRVAHLARRREDPLDRCEVPELVDVVQAQAERVVPSAAQGLSGEVGPEAELADGVEHAGARPLAHVGMTVDHARDGSAGRPRRRGRPPPWRPGAPRGNWTPALPCIHPRPLANSLRTNGEKLAASGNVPYVYVNILLRSDWGSFACRR